MAAVALAGGKSSGHGCFPPVSPIGGYSTKTSVEGRLVQLVGITNYGPQHNCGKSVHVCGPVVSGSRKNFVDGAPVARIGDPIACGDMVAKGASKTFFA
jgi:uncharacterized Zn-binding protein involved in type VI secretion